MDLVDGAYGRSDIDDEKKKGEEGIQWIQPSIPVSL